MKHILVATDGSELASKAVTEGIRLAGVLRAQVTFLTVTSPFATLGDHDAAFAQLPESFRSQALAYLDAEANQTLAAALSAAQATGVKADTVRVESRHPHEAIIATAASRGADLIVMASHGRSGVKSLVLGSVTEKVVTHSHIPVLVCR